MTAAISGTEIEYTDLGRIGYEPAFGLQRRLHAEVLAERRPPTVLLLEHEPVITISKRAGAAAHLLADGARLAREGVEVCRTDRGGDITYHGPGQLVAYPILPLRRFDLNLRQYVRLLEGVVIDTAARFGVRARRDPEAVGVWVGEETRNPKPEISNPKPQPPSPGPHSSAKLAAIGVRVRRWVSMHGLALNVDPDLEHFGLIVPCGLKRPVTSLRGELGDRTPGMASVKEAMIAAFRERLG